ncbi:hypothetical protein [Pseudoclavibacter albus]|uniref:hypothetical protein n=1 Tax=Pseudoclavibacter albus TaxID=272241 RepID=UPI0008263D70|nr:hypothetical protein [Pseudoclavibacter alba]
MTHTQGAAKAHSRPSSVLDRRIRFGAIAMILLCSIAWAVVLLLSGIRLGANLFDVFAVLIAAFVLSALSYVVLAVLAILWRSWRCELIVLPAIAVILTFLPPPSRLRRSSAQPATMLWPVISARHSNRRRVRRMLRS